MNFFQKALLLLFFCPVILKAQSNFRPGYIVNLKGDSLKGYIDYKEWHHNPREIRFKSNSNTVNSYGVNNISGFGVTGYEYYRRFIVPISQDEIVIARLSHGIDTTVIIDTAFLRIVTAGKNATLYSFSDKKEQMFIQTTNGLPVPLVRHLFLNRDDRMLADNTYIYQLKSLALTYQPGNTKLISDIEQSYYNISNIEKIVSTINGSDGNTKFVSSNQFGHRLFAGLGINNSMVKFSGSSPLSLDKASSYVLPQVNVGYDVYINKNIGKVIIRGELNFVTNKGYTFNDQSKTSGSTELLEFNQYILALNPQIIYNIYNSNDFKFYLDAGVALNFAQYSNKKHTENLYVNGAILTTSQVPFPGMKSFFPSLTTKAGIAINNKIEIYAGFNPSTLIGGGNIHNYDINLTAYRVGVNFLFEKK